MVKGQASGYGELYDKNDILQYRGEFWAGQKHGEGKDYILREGKYQVLFDGTFVHGQRHFGKTFRDGKPWYLGEFKNGIPEGQGTLFFQDGNVSYQGEIYMFSPHGRGKEYREDGTLKYEGDFVKGRRTGTGKEYNKAQVLIYEGGIERDQYQGVGALYTSEGKLIYHGEFREGVPWGHGTEFAEDGITPIYIGKFVDGVRVAADAMDRRYAKEYRKRVVTKQYLIDKANISFIYVIINMIPIKPLSAKKK